jgi:hypothetical protein
LRSCSCISEVFKVGEKGEGREDGTGKTSLRSRSTIVSAAREDIR